MVKPSKFQPRPNTINTRPNLLPSVKNPSALGTRLHTNKQLQVLLATYYSYILTKVNRTLH